MAKSQYHSLIYSYLKKYQQDPTSRIFAPLAEAYRKAGLVDEAIDIAREGLKNHPRFIGGRVALARALFDKTLYQEVIDELAPIVLDIPDNLVAQRLLAESYLMLGKVPEALTAYKMLLYFAPQDSETAQIVLELEAQAYRKGTIALRQDAEPKTTQFNIKTADAAIHQGPEAQRGRKIKRIELLQKMLQKIERYKTLHEMKEKEAWSSYKNSLS